MRVNSNRLRRLGFGRPCDVQKDAADVISSEQAVSQQVLLHLVDCLGRPVDVIGFAGDKKIVLPRGYPDVEGVPHQAKINIGRPE